MPLPGTLTPFLLHVVPGVAARQPQGQPKTFARADVASPVAFLHPLIFSLYTRKHVLVNKITDSADRKLDAGVK